MTQQTPRKKSLNDVSEEAFSTFETVAKSKLKELESKISNSERFLDKNKDTLKSLLKKGIAVKDIASALQDDTCKISEDILRSFLIKNGLLKKKKSVRKSK